MLFDSITNPVLLANLYEQAAENWINSALVKARENINTKKLVITECETVGRINNPEIQRRIIIHSTERVLSLRSELPEIECARNCIRMARQLLQSAGK